MLPFSKRPPPPDEFFLRSGDFEAFEVEEMPTVVPPMPQSPRQVWNRTAPRAPERRTPLPPVTAPAPRFPRTSGRRGSLPAANPPPRSMMPTLSAEEAFEPAMPAQPLMPVQTMQPVAPAYTMPPAYGPVPVPPNTLSPVAMSAHVPYSHPHFTSSVTPLPIARPSSKPNFMLGLTIAIAGAVLGSVLGMGVNTKRAAADVVPRVHVAAAVLDGQSAPADSLPPAQVPPSRPTPVQMPVQPQTVVARVAEQPPIVVTASPKVEPPKAKVAVVAPQAAPAHKATAVPVAPVPPPPAPVAKAPAHVAATPVAPPAPVAKPAPAPVAKAAPTPVEKPARAEKAEKPEKAEKNKDADDALKLYKAANDETNLTLGGSK